MVAYKSGSTALTAESYMGWGTSNGATVAATVKLFRRWGETNSTSYGCSKTTMNDYIWPSSTSSSFSCKVYFDNDTEIWGNTWYIDHEYVPLPLPKPGERLRKIIQDRQAPMVFVSRKPVLMPQDEREIRARETLFRVIGADKFQKFLKDGFVSVRAKSGLVYQIFPGHGVTAVYRDGDQIERLCVVLKGEFPPTDSLIMRYLIILNDEAKFRSYAIKHQIIVKKPQIIADERSLTEIFKELKKVA